jgi:hypothetical protein
MTRPSAFSSRRCRRPNSVTPSRLKRLDDQARRLEHTANGPSLDCFIAGEREGSPSLGGRSVLGWEKERAIKKRPG